MPKPYFRRQASWRHAMSPYRHASIWAVLKVDAILAFYEKRFGRAPEQQTDGTFVWKFNEDLAQFALFHTCDCCRPLLVRLRHPATRRTDSDFSFHDDLDKGPRRGHRPLSTRPRRPPRRRMSTTPRRQADKPMVRCPTCARRPCARSPFRSTRLPRRTGECSPRSRYLALVHSVRLFETRVR